MFGRPKRISESERFWARIEQEMEPLFGYWVDAPSSNHCALGATATRSAGVATADLADPRRDFEVAGCAHSP